MSRKRKEKDLSLSVGFKWISGITVLATVITVIFVGWQAFETRLSREESEYEFRFSQRPLLSLVGWTVNRIKDGEVQFSMKVENEGKNPAIGVNRDIFLQLGNDVIARGKPLNTDAQSIPLKYTIMDYQIVARLSPNQWQEVDSEKARLEIHLNISYHDDINDDPRMVGWCLYYAPHVKPSPLLPCLPHK